MAMHKRLVQVRRDISASEKMLSPLLTSFMEPFQGHIGIVYESDLTSVLPTVRIFFGSSMNGMLYNWRLEWLIIISDDEPGHDAAFLANIRLEFDATFPVIRQQQPASRETAQRVARIKTMIEQIRGQLATIDEKLDGIVK